MLSGDDRLGSGVLLASSRQRPELPLNTPQCTGQPLTNKDNRVSAARTVV